jgi:predicted enzyme related to lactoylglutathione lyase
MKFAATLPASDIERAKAWYSSVLHLEPTEITESGDVWYESGGTRLMLYPSQFAGTNQATAVNIRVDDVEVSVAELKARGAGSRRMTSAMRFARWMGSQPPPQARRWPG